MNSQKFWRWIKYRFDCLMSRGVATMIVVLFAAVMAVVMVVGLIAYLLSDQGGFGYQLWVGLLHVLDPGTLAGNDTSNVAYVALMLLATLFGLFITSTLVGIIAAGVERKFNDLRKGISIVQEMGHTIIIGFDEHIYSLLRELIEANANQPRANIVILGEQDKVYMEEAIASRISDTKTTNIICRSGSLHEAYSLEFCAVEKSRSVIINVQDDAETVKILLALAAYLKAKPASYDDLRFVASIQENQYLEVAAIAGEGRTEAIFVKDAIARIIANTCRQHGLSSVLTELFNFSGDELYFEEVPFVVGKTMRQAACNFTNAILMGVYSGGKVMLNPPMDLVIREGDKVILLEEDDGAFTLCPGFEVDESAIYTGSEQAKDGCDNLLILGSNDKLPIILEEYNHYVARGTRVIVVDDDFDQRRLRDYENLDISFCTLPVTRTLLCELLEDNIENVLLLADDSEDGERADARSLLQLILLRNISDMTGRRFSVTTELRSVDNQRLASQARVDDFVIGSNFVSLLLAQISENHQLTPAILDLLDADGSELYMKPAGNYVRLGQPVRPFTLTESAARKGETFVGYMKGQDVVVNPNKNDVVVLDKNDLLIVLAED